MLNVAILGANGFIGSRAVEFLHLRGLASVRPVVRSVTGLARLSRFDLDCRIADAFDQAALCAAFAGCDVIIHSIAGDRATILDTLTPIYRAAEVAGVKRLIYLSTASVHGQAPQPGSDEESPLSDQQPIPYNNAKVRAERRLLRLRAQGTTEVVMMRPGIVYGPRSSWISNFASDLLAGYAYLVNEGQGICNSIYIDNLVHALYLSMTAPAIDGQAFLVGDRERITWLDFYRPIAEAMGVDLAQVARLSYTEDTPPWSWREQLKAVRSSRPARLVLSLLPSRMRRAGSAALHALFAPQPRPLPSPWAMLARQEEQGVPKATLEMALLHQCQYKLPYTKASTLLGYEPVLSFDQAARRSVAWLAFAGYPVIDRDRTESALVPFEGV